MQHMNICITLEFSRNDLLALEVLSPLPLEMGFVDSISIA